MKMAPNKMDQKRIEKMTRAGKSAQEISDALLIKVESVTKWRDSFKAAAKATTTTADATKAATKAAATK